MNRFSQLSFVCALALISTLSGSAAIAQQGSSAQNAKCIDLSGTYERYNGTTLDQRIIKQTGCDTISLTKRTVMPIWIQSQKKMVDSEFVITDYEMNPDRYSSTMDMELSLKGFSVKSKQEKGTADLKSLFPVFKTTEFTLNQNGDLVETWRLQDRRPGPGYDADLEKPSVMFPLKRVQ